MRRFAPVRLVTVFDAVPGQVHATEELVRKLYALSLGLRVSQNAARIEQSHEAMHVGMLCVKFHACQASSRHGGAGQAYALPLGLRVSQNTS